MNFCFANYLSQKNHVLPLSYSVTHINHLDFQAGILFVWSEAAINCRVFTKFYFLLLPECNDWMRLLQLEQFHFLWKEKKINKVFIYLFSSLDTIVAPVSDELQQNVNLWATYWEF